MKAKSTTYPKKEDDAKQFLMFDADGQVLGRLAAEVASVLRGKHKVKYHPAVDMGDHVIVVNAEKVRLTGNKLENKIYYKHSMYPGGLKETKYSEIMAHRPEFAIRKAVKGMLPGNRIGRIMLRRLKIYTGPEHPHQAQKPVKVEVSN